MRGIALLLFAASALSAQTVAQNVEVVSVYDRAALICVGSFSGSVDDWRISYSSDTTLGFSPQTRGSASQDCIAITGVDAGATVHVRPEVDSGSGFDTSYDCGTDTPDLTPVNGGGSAACGGDGIIELTMDAAQGMTPASPSGTVDPSAWTATSRSWAATCDATNISTQMNNCRTDTNDDSGDFDVVTIPYDCDIELLLPRYFSFSNPDACAIRSTRTGTNYCPGPGERTGPGYEAECTPTLRWIGTGRSLWENSAGTWLMEDITVKGPKVSSASYEEGKDIIGFADQGGDLRIETSADHNIATSEDPPRVVVAGCKDSSGDFTALNGVYEYAVPDATHIDLTGAAGGDCTSEGVVVNEANEALAVLWFTAGRLITRRVNFDIGFPWRAAQIIVHAGTGGWVQDTFVRWGNWIMNTGSAMDAGSEYSNILVETPTTFWSMGGNDNGTLRNAFGVGFGTFFVGNDTSPATPATDIDIDKVWVVYPDYRLSTGAASGDDGQDGLGTCGRHGLLEFKLTQMLDARGLLVSGALNGCGSQNAMGWSYYLRNNISGQNDEDNGTTDVFLRTLVAHDSPHVLSVEGYTAGSTVRTNIKGTIAVENILGNRLRDRTEVSEDNADRAGSMLRLSNEGQKLQFKKFTSYLPDDNQGSFYSSKARWSAVQIEDGKLLGEPRGAEGTVLWTSDGSGGTDIRPDTDNEEAGDHFAAIGLTSENDTGTSDSYMRDLVIVGGCETAGCDLEANTSDATRVTATETTAECSTDTANYDIPDCQTRYTAAASTKADADACVDGDFSDSGACGSGDEGYDPDQGDQDLGIIRPYTGNTHPVELTSPTPTSFRIRYKMFSTSDQCHARYRPIAGGAWTKVSDTTGARDRTLEITGLTAGQQYSVWFSCENSPIGTLRTQRAPGS